MGFRKPGTKKLGGKFLSYGKKGTSKTTFLLTFPKIAAIDAETGMSFYEGTEKGKNLVMVANSQSFKEFQDDIDDIGESYQEYGVETFGLDSATKIKENIEETIMVVDEKREKKKGKSVDEVNLSIKSRGRIKYEAKKLQNLKIDLSSKGVNIVDIAQSKDIKEKVGDQFVTVGYEPDMQKGSDHDYDVVMRHFTEVDMKGVVHFKAEIEKDRLGVFKVGEIIENPSYEMWKDVLEKHKKGEALSTSFSQQVDSAKEKYANDADNDEKSWQDRMVGLIGKLGDDDKKALQEDLKANKITGFNNLTAKQQSNLEAVYAKYNK